MGHMMRLSALILVIGLPAARAASLGQVDTFTTNNHGWTNGAPAIDPVNITTGGPAGVGDHFMQMNSTGTGGAGSKLIVFNNSQWTGNFITAGITGVKADFKNLGATPLTMRLAMQDAGGTEYATSGFSLAAGSGWVTTTFSLLPANLNLVSGTDSATQVLGGITQFRLLSATSPAFNGDTIAAQVGVDNVTAIPEPGSLLVLICGGGIWACRKRRR